MHLMERELLLSHVSPASGGYWHTTFELLILKVFTHSVPVKAHTGASRSLAEETGEIN